MTDGPLHVKLNPHLFPNMSPPMAAILGFVLEREYTTPTLADVQVTPDGHVLGWPAEQEGVGHSMHLGAAADLRAKLSRLVSYPKSLRQIDEEFIALL